MTGERKQLEDVTNGNCINSAVEGSADARQASSFIEPSLACKGVKCERRNSPYSLTNENRFQNRSSSGQNRVSSKGVSQNNYYSSNSGHQHYRQSSANCNNQRSEVLDDHFLCRVSWPRGVEEARQMQLFQCIVESRTDIRARILGDQKKKEKLKSIRRERFAEIKENKKQAGPQQNIATVIAKILKNKGEGLSYNPLQNMLYKNI